MSSDDSSDHEANAENPEFFDPTQRRFPRFSKDQAWMGVFGDDEEPDKASSSQSKENKYSAEINFVQSTKEVAKKTSESEDSEEEAQPRNFEEEEDFEDGQPSFQGFQQTPIETRPKSQNKSSGQGISFTPIMKKPLNKNQGPIKPLPKDYASFLNNPQGNVIKRMMERMGFQEGRGLGPDGKGRVAPIEVRLRGKQSGIGFGSKEQPEVKSESESEDDDEEMGKLPLKPKKSKIQYKSLDEAMARVEQAMPKEQGAEGEMLALSEDVRLVVDLCMDSLSHLEQSMKNMNAQRRQAIQEQETLQPLLDRAAQEQSTLESLVELCTRMELISLDQSIDFVTLRPHLEILEEQRCLVKDHPLSKFVLGRLQEMSVSLILPLFTRLMESWDVESDPTLMVDFFKDWANLFVPTSDEDYDAYDESRSMSPYDSLMYHIWLPKVRAYLENDWNPLTSDAALTLMQGWSQVLPSFLTHCLVEKYAVPKLLASFEAWDPHSSPCSFHYCFHPWLPLLADGLDALRPVIRAKLASIIRDLDSFPPDFNLFSDYIKPWLPILSEKDRVKLIDHTAYSKLQYVLSSRLVIDPSDQVLDHFHRVMHWRFAMSSDLFGQLLSTSFFPSFTAVLSHWLALDPPITHVMQWYSFWKSLFPEDVITTKQVESCLRDVLVQVNSHMDTHESAR